MSEGFFKIGCVIVAILIALVIVLAKQGKMPDLGPHQPAPAPTQVVVTTTAPESP